MRLCVGLLAILAAFAAARSSAERLTADRVRTADKTGVFCLGREEKCWIAYQFSLATGTWTPYRSPEGPVPRRAVRWAEGTPGIVILDADKNCSGYFFDASTLEWKSVPEAPSGNAPREVGSFVEFADGKLIAWGLRQGPPHGAALDLSTLKWIPMPDAPTQVGYRSRHATSGKRVFSWGGYSSALFTKAERDNQLQTGVVYDLSKNAWEQLPEAPIRFRYDQASGVWRDRFFVFEGGCGTELGHP